MSPFELIKSLFYKSDLSKSEGERCSELIISHLHFLDRLCEKVVKKSQSKSCYCVDGFLIHLSPGATIPENAKEELLARVVEHLEADNFKAVRDFKGKSKFTTYLTAICNNLAIDTVRQREGRSRVGERAEKLSDLCKKVYELVYEKGWAPHEAQSCLEIEYGIHMDIDQIHECLEKMRGRDKKIGNILWGESGFVTISDEGFREVVVPDCESNPETRYAEQESSILSAEVFAELFDTLDGEEMLILRMRFPPNDNEVPKTFRKIADIVGISEDKAGRTVERILREFREKLMSRGVSFHDLI